MAQSNLADFLTDAADAFPGRTAIVLGDYRLDYRQLDALSNQVANLLVARGIRPGDKVALSCVNIPWFTVAYYGILKAGAVVVPLNILLRASEISYYLRDSEARAYLCFEGTPDLKIGEQGWAGFREVDECKLFFLITAGSEGASPINGAETLNAALDHQPSSFDTVATDEDDTAVILYTSGTTGQPRGAELRHRNMRDNALLGTELFGADPAAPDTYLCVLPLFHSFGQTVIQNGAIAFGGTLVMLPRFEARAALERIIAGKVTFFGGVPTMYWALLSEAAATADEAAAVAANLRVAVSAGAALPVEVHRQFQSVFGVTILEGYGLSETSFIAAFSVWGEPPRVGSIGAPVPDVEMTLLATEEWREIEWDADAVGEIAIRGHNVMKGYYGRPQATSEVIQDGWFRTGDLARRDEDGWYYVVDRSKDMVSRGGYNVYPREVEEVLMSHPAISLAAVVGVPHEVHGQEVKAFVVLEPGADITADELVAWGKEQMAAYMHPRIVKLVPALPMTATDMILKRELSQDSGCGHPGH